MINVGYRWTIQPDGDAWVWRILGRDDGYVVCQGRAATRAVAAAFVVRAMAIGVSTPAAPQSLAA